MNFKELLQNMLYLVFVGVIPLLVKYAIVYIQVQIKKNSELIDNEKLEQYMIAVTDILERVVISTNQVFVDNLKKNGQFTPEAQAEAKEMAIETAKELITVESKQAIEILYGDFNIYLETQIEAMVREYKLNVN